MLALATSLTPVGAYSLRESISFGFGGRAAGTDLDVMRLAFVLDGYATAVGAAVRQAPDGVLEVELSESVADVAGALRQVARVLSVDIDAAGWDALGRREPLIGRLQDARPGLRPPLFYSAYEAAAWAVLSARRPHVQMAALRDSLAAAHGTTFFVAGQRIAAFPAPSQLLAVSAFPGLPEVKLRRLHGVAEAALAGRLGTTKLRALDPQVASGQLRELNGIGPFYAQLVILRPRPHRPDPHR